MVMTKDCLSGESLAEKTDDLMVMTKDCLSGASSVLK